MKMFLLEWVSKSFAISCFVMIGYAMAPSVSDWGALWIGASSAMLAHIWWKAL